MRIQRASEWRLFARAISCWLALMTLCCLLAGFCFAGNVIAYADDSSSSAGRTALAQDSAGTAFSSAEELVHAAVSGDLFWGGSQLQADDLSVGKDLIGAAGVLDVQNASVYGDVRFAGRSLQLERINAKGDGTVLGQRVLFGSQSKVGGFYCGAEELDFEGTARYLMAYANKVYFDGTVNGDVTLSAQDIVIGPHAKVTGTLNVRSGQDLEVPASARIASIDTSLNNPNAIDQVSEIRAKIAPYFQLGSVLFVVVACALIALLLLWVGDRQLNEAHRVLRAHPLGHVLLGLLSVIALVVATVVCFALVFTIPAGLALLFLLLAALLACVPFTGASLALMFPRFPRSVRAMVGAGVGGGLLFVPYIRWVVASFSLVYLTGYIARSLFVGHDGAYLRALEERRRNAATSGKHEPPDDVNRDQVGSKPQESDTEENRR